MTLNYGLLLYSIPLIQIIMQTKFKYHKSFLDNL